MDTFPVIAHFFMLPIFISACMFYGILIFEVKKDFKSLFTRVALYLLLMPCYIALVIATIASFLHILEFIIGLFN